jgi:hypothetical protein
MAVRFGSLAHHLENGMKRMVVALALCLLAAAAVADRMAAPAGAEVYFIAPQNGAKVHGPVTVKFGLKGFGIAPAGIKFDNTGHHHLLVDTDIKDVNLDAPLPATDKVLHFGKGQTETVLTLTPGKHTLQLIMGDYTHLSFDPPLISKKITITVE